MKTAVFLFNLGGPDSQEAVQPFLFNLFNDPAIIGAPTPVRWLLAKMISGRRAPVAREIYQQIGGRSPLVPLTQEQAEALDQTLNGLGQGEFKSFLAMRYWHPFAAEAILEAKRWGAARAVLLPLYPQYSRTTSGSSVKDWHRAARAAGFDVPTRTICCYPTEDGFVEAVAALTAEGIAKAGTAGNPRVLFSAHGLPKKVVAGGDPYQFHVEQSAQAVVKRLNIPDLDWLVSYQSRVGPLEWIGPATDDEIKRAGADKVPLVVVPIAFVSEHSETLVELDLEYGHLAVESGVSLYVRVPAVATHPAFVAGLARLVTGGLAGVCNPCSHQGGRICPAAFGNCPNTGH